MSGRRYDDKFHRCRPELTDDVTGVPLPEGDLHVVAVAAMWEKTTRAERNAFHRVRCLGSQVPTDVAIMDSLMGRIQAACDDTPCCQGRRRAEN